MERKGISMNKKSTHPFAPEIPEGATKLIIGTMPPYRFCNTDEMLRRDLSRVFPHKRAPCTKS